jgi:hypothetical protein
MMSLLAETGFDRAKSPLGLLFVIAVTLFMLLFIVAGAVYMKSQEDRARALRAERRLAEDGGSKEPNETGSKQD